MKLTNLFLNIKLSWQKDFNKSIIISYLTLLIIGLSVSFSVSYSVARKLETQHFYLFYRHTLFVILGLIAIILCIYQNYKRVKIFSIIGYVSIFCLLVFVLFQGGDVKGAKRWIDLFGGLKIQPSELLKPFFIVVNAVNLFKFYKTEQKKYLWFVFAPYVLLIGLLFLEPDFGMIIVFSSILCIQLLFSSIKFRNLVIIGCMCLTLLITASLFLEHVMFRIKNFFGSGEGDNYQTGIAMQAIRTGGLLGKGIGESKLKVILPDAHNDFIFAIIGEELGYVFYLFLFSLYLVIIFAGFASIVRDGLYEKSFYNYLKPEDTQELIWLRRQIVVAVNMIIFIEFAIHVSVSTGLIPPKGITLPFISYGGSSLLSHAILVGLLLNFSRKRFETRMFIS